MTAISDVDRAFAVISAAREHGVIDTPMPESDGSKLAVASDIATQAEIAWSAKIQGDAVRAVLVAAGSELVSGVAPSQTPGDAEAGARPPTLPADAEPGPAAQEDPTRPLAEASEEEAPDEGDPPSPSSLTEGIREAYAERALAQAKIDKEKLPIPSEWEGDPPELPRDFSTLSDSELRSLHARFHACLARTNWLVAVESVDQYAAQRIADHRVAKLVRDMEKPKGVTVTELKATASDDEDVVKWRETAAGHEATVVLLKALRETYDSTCARLSREWSMREAERGGSPRT